MYSPVGSSLNCNICKANSGVDLDGRFWTVYSRRRFVVVDDLVVVKPDVEEYDQDGFASPNVCSGVAFVRLLGIIVGCCFWGGITNEIRVFYWPETGNILAELLSSYYTNLLNEGKVSRHPFPQ